MTMIPESNLIQVRVGTILDTVLSFECSQVKDGPDWLILRRPNLPTVYINLKHVIWYDIKW